MTSIVWSAHTYRIYQIDSSTINGNVEFVHSQYSSVFLRHKCQLSFVSDKIINIRDNFRIKCLFYNKYLVEYTVKQIDLEDDFLFSFISKPLRLKEIFIVISSNHPFNQREFMI